MPPLPHPVGTPTIGATSSTKWTRFQPTGRRFAWRPSPCAYCSSVSTMGILTQTAFAPSACGPSWDGGISKVKMYWYFLSRKLLLVVGLTTPGDARREFNCSATAAEGAAASGSVGVWALPVEGGAMAGSAGGVLVLGSGGHTCCSFSPSAFSTTRVRVLFVS